MKYSETDALYDALTIQVKLCLVITCFLANGWIDQNKVTYTNSPAFIFFFLYLWLCFLLLFFVLDLLFLMPVIYLLRSCLPLIFGKGESPSDLLQK